MALQRIKQRAGVLRCASIKDGPRSFPPISLSARLDLTKLLTVALFVQLILLVLPLSNFGQYRVSWLLSCDEPLYTYAGTAMCGTSGMHAPVRGL